MSLITQTRPPSGAGAVSGQRQRHWLNLPLQPRTEGAFDDIVRALPHFGRQPFTMASVNGEELGVNSYLDMVYRLQSVRVRSRSLSALCRRIIDWWTIIRYSEPFSKR
jgi:hypothetical protein